MADLDRAEAAIQAASPSKAAVAKVPETRWEDVGGLHEVRREILDAVELPLRCPQLFAGGLRRRSGVLLYGPPGTGKTLVAKAVATECGLAFLSVKGPELLDMYVGESERNVRRVFAQARCAAPAVLFFDELDALAPARGRGSDGGGVMDRVVAQILAEIDGVDGGGGGSNNGGGDSDDDEEEDDPGARAVVVLGATNRPDLLDPALLRPGRFDRLLYLGAHAGPEGQLAVLRAAARRFRLGPGAQPEEVVARGLLRPGLTGADVAAVASEAASRALHRRVQEIDDEVEAYNSNLCRSVPETKGYDSDGSGKRPAESGPSLPPPAAAAMTAQRYLEGLSEVDLETEVTLEDFEAAAAVVAPSVSTEELEHYERLRIRFSGSGEAVS